MDFVDDLNLIDHDIKNFRENKQKYWLEKMNKDNSRLYVNSQLKGQSESSGMHGGINSTEYKPYNRERNLLQIVPNKTGIDYMFIFTLAMCICPYDQPMQLNPFCSRQY